MKEIMIIRSDRDGRSPLRTFQVDDSTLSKLTRIRGNLYQDNPRLIPLKDVPTSSPEPVYSPEAIAATEKAFALYRLTREAGERSRATAIQPQPPQPERPKTPEELWRHDPALRAEFNNNLNAYLAYCKAVRDGRAKRYGQGTSTR